MSSRALSRCGISEGSPTLGRLVARGVHTAAQLLRQFSALELSEALDLSPAEAAALLRTVSGAICPPARRASDLLSSATGRRASVGLPALDAALRGGLPGGALTELVGPAGVGKTQASRHSHSFITQRENQSSHPICCTRTKELQWSPQRVVHIGTLDIAVEAQRAFGSCWMFLATTTRARPFFKSSACAFLQLHLAHFPMTVYHSHTCLNIQNITACGSLDLGLILS